MTHLAYLYQVHGLFDRAEPIYRQARELNLNAWSYPEISAQLAHLYNEWKKPELAVKLRAELNSENRMRCVSVFRERDAARFDIALKRLTRISCGSTIWERCYNRGKAMYPNGNDFYCVVLFAPVLKKAAEKPVRKIEVTSIFDKAIKNQWRSEPPPSDDLLSLAISNIGDLYLRQGNPDYIRQANFCYRRAYEMMKRGHFHQDTIDRVITRCGATLDLLKSPTQATAVYRLV